MTGKERSLREEQLAVLWLIAGGVAALNGWTVAVWCCFGKAAFDTLCALCFAVLSKRERS